MRKKEKLDFYSFVKYLENINNSFYSHGRNTLERTLEDNSVIKIRGFLYKISKPLTDEQKEYLLKFKNVKLFNSQCQYAPEIKHNAVFIGDKKIF